MPNLFGRRRGESKSESKNARDAKRDAADDDDLDLVLDCARHCLSPQSLDRWRGFFETRERLFDVLDEEHRLEHTAAHREFLDLVEEAMEGWLRERGYDVPSFARRPARTANEPLANTVSFRRTRRARVPGRLVEISARIAGRAGGAVRAARGRGRRGARRDVRDAPRRGDGVPGVPRAVRRSARRRRGTLDAAPRGSLDAAAPPRDARRGAAANAAASRFARL